VRIVANPSGADTLVCVYKLTEEADAALMAAAPDAVIVNDTGPGMQGYYRKSVVPMPEMIEAAAALMGNPGWRPDRVILAGFSEGCEALERQLLLGFTPNGILAADGIQFPPPDGASPGLTAWRRYADLAKDGDVLFYASCSGFMDTKIWIPVQTSLELVFGNSFGYGTPAAPTITAEGKSAVYGARSVHHEQGYVVLPQMLAAAMRETPSGSGWGLVKKLGALALAVAAGWLLKRKVLGVM
jgi:hypothetical protein